MTGLLLILLVLFFPVGIGMMIYFSRGSTSVEDDMGVDSIEDLDSAERVLDIAENFEQEHSYRKAIKTWSHYQNLEPEDPAGYFRRGINWQKIDEHERALHDLSKVESMESDPPPMVWFHKARSQAALDREDDALSSYISYLEKKPENLSAWKKVAAWATKRGYYSRARNLWDHIRDRAESPLRERAILHLAEIDLERNQSERAAKTLDKLDEQALDEGDAKLLMYLRGRMMERKGKESAALKHYRDLYDRDSGFRDVGKRLEDHRAELDGDALIERYKKLPRERFAEFCQDLVREMGYEVMDVELKNDEEVSVECRESGGMNIMNVDRCLVAFKRWDNEAGQMAVKDFEMNLVEERFDQGYFVNPGGFKTQAKQLAEGNPDLTLTGPEELAEKLKNTGNPENLTAATAAG